MAWLSSVWASAPATAHTSKTETLAPLTPASLLNPTNGVSRSHRYASSRCLTAIIHFERSLQRNIVVGLDRSTRMDAQLVIGQVSQEVSIEGAAPASVRGRAEVRSGLSTAQINDLPTLNRNFTSLELLMPGAQNNTYAHAASENHQYLRS